MNIDAFAQTFWHDFAHVREGVMKDEILSKGKDYIIKVDEDEYKDYLFDKFLLEPIKILDDTEVIKEPVKFQKSSRDSFNRKIVHEGYSFTISYNYDPFWPGQYQSP